MDAPPLVEASMAGAPPHGEASAMDASTGGGASLVDASFFLKISFRKRGGVHHGRPTTGGGVHDRRLTMWWSACHGRLPFFLKKIQSK